MLLPKPALACALASALLAAVTVAHTRVGLGLTLALLLAIAAGWRRASPPFAALAVALAAQPVLRDAGWVVAIDVAAAVVAAAVAFAPPGTWAHVRHALLAALNLIDGVLVVGRGLAGLRPRTAPGQLAPVARGVALAAGLVTAFGALFVTADRAFADVLDGAVSIHVESQQLAWRCLLGLAFAGAAGALARVGRMQPDRPEAQTMPPRTELVIGLAALVALFATFVAVQLRVLFGGAEYVRATTGLGYGEYARQGFVQLLVVAALTLLVVAVAARRRDRVVRGLLGLLCLLTLVVLWSAYHRLNLVEDAYGLTRVRYAGHAVVVWLAAVFALLIAGGANAALSRRAPWIATAMTLAGALAFSLSNPDARIAQRAVDRASDGRPVDTGYLAGLSADALGVLERLPAPERAVVVPAVRARLARRDGIGGFNLSRARARRR